MKKLSLILCLLMLSVATVFAQNDKRLTKAEIGRVNLGLYAYPVVKQGEFVVDFEKLVFDQSSYTLNYRYFVIVRDRNDNPKFIAMNNNNVLNFTKMDLPVEILRVGYTQDECVYISKTKTSNMEGEIIKYNLIVGDKNYGPYDGIYVVLPKGFVYKNKGIYNYVEYDRAMADVNNYSIAEQANYEGEFVQCSINDKLLKFVPKEKVKYFKCYDGHYYILYNDKAMNNTLLIVDGVGYELDGVVSNLNFKFSHNGDHWIAAGNDYVMVDGVYVARISGVIKDAIINNKGDYFYIIDGDGYSEKAYLKGEIIADGVEVKSLTVDDDEHFNYIFKNAKGVFYAIDNDVREYNENVKNYYYPALNDAVQDFVVVSDDGKHKLEYHNDSPYIDIDGTMIESLMPPHYVVWKEKDRCFMWNTIENFKLMVYKYNVK